MSVLKLSGWMILVNAELYSGELVVREISTPWARLFFPLNGESVYSRLTRLVTGN